MVGTYSFTFNNVAYPTVRSLVTYLYDNEGLITNLGSNTFATSSNLIRVYVPGVIIQTGISICQDIVKPFIFEMPNCTSVPTNFIGNWQIPSGIGNKNLILPRCTNFGASEANNSVFTSNGAIRMKLYVPIAKQTSNSGGVEGDIAFVAGSTSSSIVYVPNYTKPNAIADLSAGTVTSTTIQLNFTPPSSANTIDFYEVYLNSMYKGRITASGQSITGLTTITQYKIEILAVDIYYNKSLVSNSINVTTI
ncbi:fibronectin type III domain-containing protein [Flavobacterium sp. 3-210]